MRNEELPGHGREMQTELYEKLFYIDQHHKMIEREYRTIEEIIRQESAQNMTDEKFRPFRRELRQQLKSRSISSVQYQHSLRKAKKGRDQFEFYISNLL